MKPGEEINNQLDAIETKIELLMKYLGLKFEFLNDSSDCPTGIRQSKRRELMKKLSEDEQVNAR